MTTYTAVLSGPSNNPARPDTEAPEASEDTPADLWLDRFQQIRDDIADAGFNAEDDPDTFFACALAENAAETKAAIDAAEKRAIAFVGSLLQSRIAEVQAKLSAARQERAVEALAFSQRLDRMADQLAARDIEIAELRTRLSTQEKEHARTTSMFEKELARERALRRLLDAQRSRPHTQRVASELAKRHAMKALEAATTSKAETVTEGEAA